MKSYPVESVTEKIGGSSQDRKDGGVRMGKGSSAINIKTAQIILIRIVVAMPGDNIKRDMILPGHEEGVIEFADYMVLKALLFIIKRGNRSLKVPHICKTI
jgi:hypothetical protein